MPTRSHAPRGLALVNAAVLLFGLAGVLGRVAALPAPLITLARVVIAGVALLPYVALRRLPVRPRDRASALLLCAQGVLLAFHWTAFFEAVLIANVAIGLLAFSTFPLFTAALEPLLLRQRPSRPQLLAALLVLLGVVLLAPSMDPRDRATQGVAWGIAAAASFALLSVTNRWLGRQYPSSVITLYQDGVAALVLLPALWLARPAVPVTASALLALLALGLLCTALAHTLFIAGLRTVTAQLASLCASLEPVWGIGFAVLLLGEVPTTRTLVGGALIVAATTLPAAWSLTRRLARPSGPRGHHRRPVATPPAAPPPAHPPGAATA